MTTLLLAAAAVLLVTGGVASALRRWPALAAPIGAAGRVAGGVLGAVAAGRILYGGRALGLSLPRALPPVPLELDPLAGLVLLPMFALAVPTGLFAAGEARAGRRPAWLGSALLLVVTGLLAAVLRPGMLASLPPDARRLAADPTTGGLLALTLATTAITTAPGLAERRRTTASGAALASVVVAGLGLFGLFRTAAFVAPPPLWVGGGIAGIGLLLALTAMSWARQEWELPRILARSALRGAGVLLVAAGVGLVGFTLRHVGLAFLGFATAALHLLAFAAYQPLLLLASDAVRDATGTTDLDALGGLGRRMRDTAFGFGVGAAAAAGLPPGPAFAPQFLLYAALLTVAMTAALPFRLAGIAALAGLAIADLEAVRTYFRLYRRVFLRPSPGPEAADAVEVSSPRRIPLHFLAILALGLGLAPLVGLVAVAGPTSAVVAGLRSNRLTAALDAAMRLGRIAGLLALLAAGLAALAAAAAWLWSRRRARAAAAAAEAPRADRPTRARRG
ncbi:MAG: hypothetical protein IRZ00_04045 [Gemmatimonadetes bacterium]|nr:hypothetical protein [Gemmatimonadota bacterium]